MEKTGSVSKSKNIKIFRLKLAITLLTFGILFIMLFSGEFFSTAFNNRFDEMGLDMSQRWHYVFKPTVLALYVVISSIISIIILGSLKPLFNYIKNKTDYEKARIATVKLPWVSLIVQVGFWFIGTTAYFILKKWQADSGIPYSMVLFMKMASGLVGAIFTALIANVIAMKVKSYLNITSIRNNEYDKFIRVKDYLIVFSIVLYISSTLGYLIYYYSNNVNAVPHTPGFIIGLVAIFAFLMAISVGLMLLSKREYFYQINFLKDKLNDLQKGEADISKRIVLINFDEIGELAFSINTFMDKMSRDFKIIRDIVSQLGNSTKKVATASYELAANTEEQASSAEEIASSMEVFAKVMDSIRDNVLKQTNSVTENARSSQELFNGLKTIINHTYDLKEKTASNIESIKTGVRSANTSVFKTFKINTSMNDITEKIQLAGEKTNSIDEMLNSIENIADQTNLLSMNAAIEAAHAGDAGRGFAIVAQEIRGLAETSSKSVQNIADVMEQIKDSVIEAVNIAQFGLKEANAHSGLAQEASNALETIIDNMNKTGDMIIEINKIAENQDSLIKNFSEETENLKASSINIKEAVDREVENAHSIENTLNSMNQSFVNNATHSGELSDLAENLHTIGIQLADVVDHFKIREDIDMQDG